MLKLMDLLIEGVYDKGIFKAVFMAGGPGSGKSFMAKNIFGIPDKARVSVSGLRVVNSDTHFRKRSLSSSSPAKFEHGATTKPL